MRAKTHRLRGAVAMTDAKREQPVHSAVKVIPLNVRANRGRFRLPRWIATLLRVLHESRTHQGERVIRRYRHLICYSDSHPDLKMLRRKCRSRKDSDQC
jgi:hypothetical protein